MNADGSGRRQLTDDPQWRDDNPRLSNDGRLVVFQREAANSDEHLAILELATGDIVDLPATCWSCRSTAQQAATLRITS